MNIKIWIGDNKKKRKKVLSLIDINNFGGKGCFRDCTAIFIYNSKDDKFDVRAEWSSNKDYFNNHKNIEIKIYDHHDDDHICPKCYKRKKMKGDGTIELLCECEI